MSATDSAGGPAKPRPRRGRWLLIGLALVGAALMVFVVTATAWEYTNSSQFCGLTCHTMPPEYTAYNVSPHARVACVDCHLGEKSVVRAIPRKAMEVRHLTDALFTSYETPIYVKNLRPARDTCEQCHFPEKFSTDAVREIRHYAADKENSESRTWLVMKTGGGSKRQGLGKGIHWHIENQVSYIATDDLKQKIPYVRQVDADGTVTEYVDVEAGLPADFATANSDKLRVMDCTDCHNRVSHQFRNPDQILDQALARQQIDRNMPEIRRKGAEVLFAKYENQQQAAQAIEGLDSWYQTNYPDYYKGNQARVREAVDLLKRDYQNSVFPEMDVAWETHPDNTGHNAFPGCFRCHDGKHISAGNSATIRLECNVCHTIPEVQQAGGPAPVIAVEKPSEPATHLTSNWVYQHRYQFDGTCGTCHTLSNPGGADNSSFCSNSACHGQQWKFVGLDAPKVRELMGPAKGPGSGSALPIPHPMAPRTDCSICHGQAKVRPMPPNHASYAQADCTTCHKPTLEEPSPNTPAGGGPPAIPHELAGRQECNLCHNPEGGMKPSPKDHLGRDIQSCTTCHKPAAGQQPTGTGVGQGAASATPPIPHSLAGLPACTTCHNVEGGVKPAPKDHIGRDAQSCTACHKPSG